MASRVAVVPINGQGGTILHRVNPAAILIGMGFAAFFSWWLSGGQGNSNDRRRATTHPVYELGEVVGNGTVTGLRTRWEYQIDDEDGWWDEELL